MQPRTNLHRFLCYKKQNNRYQTAILFYHASQICQPVVFALSILFQGGKHREPKTKYHPRAIPHSISKCPPPATGRGHFLYLFFFFNEWNELVRSQHRM